MTDFTPDRSLFKDVMGRYRTQSLFLEHKYSTEEAIYTLSDEDKEYEGVVYPSLRRLYMEVADPTEYEFAKKYLWGWEHWQQMLGNNFIRTHVERWREELEVKLRAEAVKEILKMKGNSFNAAKWAADGHWNVKRGRPSKEEQARERAIRDRVAEELEDESSRIVHLVRKDNA